MRALFTEAARFQFPARRGGHPGRAQAGLSIIPDAAGHDIDRKAHAKYLDLGTVARAGQHLRHQRSGLRSHTSRDSFLPPVIHARVEAPTAGYRNNTVQSGTASSRGGSGSTFGGSSEALPG